MKITPTGYAQVWKFKKFYFVKIFTIQMTSSLLNAMNGKGVVALYEGGYFVESIEQG